MYGVGKSSHLYPFEYDIFLISIFFF